MSTKGTVRGTVKVFFTRERPTGSGGYGFGFIHREDGSDVYVHARRLSDIIAEHGEDSLKGLEVVFEVRDGKKGQEAVNVLTAEAWKSRKGAVGYDPASFILQGLGIHRELPPEGRARLAQLAELAIVRLEGYEQKEYQRLLEYRFHARALYRDVSAYIFRALTLPEKKEAREILGL